jgi:hypothetical protein
MSAKKRSTTKAPKLPKQVWIGITKSGEFTGDISVTRGPLKDLEERGYGTVVAGPFVLVERKRNG